VTFSDPGRDKVIEQLSAAIDQLRIDVARVEMWAAAVAGFSKPVPGYDVEQYRLPPRDAPEKETPRKAGH